MNISDEAVDAAARALWDIERGDGGGQYEDCRDGAKRYLRRQARAALEAAVSYPTISA